jgi:hypothetical protein
MDARDPSSLRPRSVPHGEPTRGTVRPPEAPLTESERRVRLSQPEPIVRARFCQEWLAAIEVEEEPYRTRFFERIPPEMRAQIEGASRVAWMPMAVHVKLADIQLEAFGTVRSHDYYRRSFVRSLKGPIFGPLVLTAARLLGLSPGTFVRWAGRGYEAAYKNSGTLTGEVLGPGRARLTFVDLPSVCTASDAWLTSSQGSSYGMYDALEVDGVCRIDKRGRAEGTIRLELEWSEQKRAK